MRRPLPAWPFRPSAFGFRDCSSADPWPRRPPFGKGRASDRRLWRLCAEAITRWAANCGAPPLNFGQEARAFEICGVMEIQVPIRHLRTVRRPARRGLTRFVRGSPWQFLSRARMSITSDQTEAVGADTGPFQALVFDLGGVLVA